MPSDSSRSAVAPPVSGGRPDQLDIAVTWQS
jgi:hypothetical protein